MLAGFLKGLFAGKQAPAIFDSLVTQATAAFEDLDFTTVVERLRRADALGILDAEGLHMLGAALVHGGQFEQAEDVLLAALKLDPDRLDAQKMLATKHLLSGDWIEGFRLLEGMRHAAMRRAPESKLDANRDWLRFIDYVLADIPSWRGEPLDGKRILVWSEHGRGDAIMTLRFLSVLQDKYGASEVAGMSDAVEKCLFHAAGALRFLEVELDRKVPATDFDYQCSLFSLLKLLQVRPDAIPGKVPYLRIPEERRAAWNTRVPAGPNLKVGLVWGGNAGAPFDKLRSVPLAAFAPLFDHRNVDFFSLQKDGPRRADMDSQGLPMTDLMDHCGDFIDTAALIERLDLVVSVDSAVAHLAGAMGQPVWLLNRYESEWRWLRGREDSVWYPSMRIYSQTEPRNWTPVIDHIASDLTPLVAARTGQLA